MPDPRFFRCYQIRGSFPFSPDQLETYGVVATTLQIACAQIRRRYPGLEIVSCVMMQEITCFDEIEDRFKEKESEC